MNDITSTITKPLAVLGENGSGYTKEANFVSWNGNDAKLDIRIWYPGHERGARELRSPRTRAETFTKHSKKFMSRSNSFSRQKGCLKLGTSNFD